MALKNVVYLSVEQYTELKANGSITVDGQTIVYSEDDVYVTPDDTAEQIADLQAQTTTLESELDSLQGTVDGLVLNEVYPVGSIYMSESATSPAELFGGTWEQIKDKFLLSAGDTYTAGSEGGSADVTLTVEQIPSHDHIQQVAPYGNGWSRTQLSYTSDPVTSGGIVLTADGVYGEYEYSTPTKTDVSGGDASHNNLPPYLAVNIWKRIA